MNLFSKFFQGKKKTLADNVFGKIEYDGVVWTYIPAGAGVDFMITIYAPETGPSDYQKEYFLKLRKRLDNLISETKRFIKNQHIKNIDIGVLNLYSINLGDASELKKNVHIIELSDENANEIHRVTFENNVPIKYEMEG